MKNKFLHNVLKTTYHTVLGVTSHIVGAKNAKMIDALVRFKRPLNLYSPKNLAEKTAWLEYHDKNELRVTCTDKWAVRDYIRSKGYESLLVPVYGDVYTSVDALDLSSLPDSFVIKATHGCYMNIICTDKSSFDLDQAKSKINTWLHTTYGTDLFETHYKPIPHRFYIEKCLDDADAIIDYKIFCYNGKPSFIFVCGNRVSGLTFSVYDLDWKRIHGVITDKHNTTHEFPRPENLETMLQIAAKLSEDFVFVRVDLYNINNTIYFSELTFTPGACIFPYFKSHFLVSEGKKLILPKLK